MYYNNFLFTGIPVTTDSDNLEGQVVSLICLLSDPKLKTAQALDAVGPKAYEDLVKDGFTKYTAPSSAKPC